eukprot:TRINITY_DN47195_c0_g1_i1.p1 TRINITY_DN47195_c0_g1~~TRINITY_DN47195_c0_g1_i1.p1  ORF type:complete len:356 (-),score=45.27 TRINITY_DN47195_c0_g1_i1:371-1438(-)
MTSDDSAHRTQLCLVPRDDVAQEKLPNADQVNKLFGLPPPSEPAQLRKIYLRLALQFHPDKWPEASRAEATTLFQAISLFYETLADPSGGRRIHKRVKTPVAAAAELGDIDELRMLLQDRPQRAIEEDDNGTYPLMFAAKGGSVDAMILLVEYGADIHQRTPLGWSTLLFAALANQVEAVRWLISRGAIVTTHELILAAYSGSAQGLRSLAEHYPDDVANVRTEDDGKSGGPGKTLLHVACTGMCHLRRDRSEGYLACLEFLLMSGVPVDALEPLRGQTCLQLFIGRGEWKENGFEESSAHLKVLKLLCDHGASPVARDRDGASAVSLASDLGLSKVSECLRQACLSNGAASSKI